ncbi:helix-turn-helix domain-containing protein [Nocardia testacea]|uniref:helix-turn-helix domain-containing protein n=1 Tax=Nocardia testacea TaxID=248551 RepID=UPI003C30218F
MGARLWVRVRFGTRAGRRDAAGPTRRNRRHDPADLLHTLATHPADDRNRRRTARALGIHANALNYRLRLIARYTGPDPADDLWHLQAALVASAYGTVSAGAAVPGADHESPQRAGGDPDIRRVPERRSPGIDLRPRARMPAPARGR